MKTGSRFPTAMTVAGSDPSGGAGIHADIKTFESLGVFATSAITAVTVQNTTEVKGIFPIGPEIVSDQITTILEDVGTDAVKTGLLFDEGIVEAVGYALEGLDTPFIIDPVIISSSGTRLLSRSGVDSLKKHLFPKADLITPNIPEAEMLTGKKIEDIDDMIHLGGLLRDMGPGAVLVTGGHLQGDRITDVLVSEDGIRRYEKERIPRSETHGTGCVLSAAITAYVARGRALEMSVEAAQDLVQRSIQFSLKGNRKNIAEPMAFIRNEAARYPTLAETRRCMEMLEKENIYGLIPEVSSNFVVCLPYALNTEETVGVEGRIVRFKDRIHTHNPWFGVSDHVARFLINIREHDLSVTSSMNIKLTKRIKERCKELSYEISYAPRQDEPGLNKRAEHQTMGWAAHHVMREREKAPDIIIDEGEVGKEPMIRVLAHSPAGLVKKILDIWNGL